MSLGLKCDMREGCCFCEAQDYKRCTLCGHRVCTEHAGERLHNCERTETRSKGRHGTLPLRAEITEELSK